MATGRLGRGPAIRIGVLKPLARNVLIQDQDRKRQYQAGPAKDRRRNQHVDIGNQGCQAADRLRDKYGDSAVSLAAGMKGSFRERVQENPANLPGKNAK